MVAAGADAAATARWPRTLGQEVGSASPAALAPEQPVRAEHAPEMAKCATPESARETGRVGRDLTPHPEM